jgi:hypothetical protein
LQHYGDLHVNHLIDHEKSGGGQRRIVRWLNRLKHASTAAASAPPMSPNGSAVSAAGEQQERMVLYRGQLRPESEARQEGYNGGFENYREGEHEGDDLEAMVRKYQAQGLLPGLEKEKAQVGHE